MQRVNGMGGGRASSGVMRAGGASSACGEQEASGSP